jgi:UDP-2,3-diacylglucosamine pyrophosphatase LpxH
MSAVFDDIGTEHSSFIDYDQRHDSQYQEVNVVVSDLHIGAGPSICLEYGGRRGIARAWRATLHHVFHLGEKHETIDNLLEEFRFDGGWGQFLDLISSHYRHCEALRLRLLGDIFDPLVVPWEGRYEDPPYEQTAVIKLRQIISGHPNFFLALAKFMTQSNCWLDIFVGNHDLFMVWSEVQAELRRTIAGDDPEVNNRLRFISHQQDYRLIERGILYEHGHFAEPHNSVEARNTIVTDVLGQRLKQPILNAPYGNYMFVDMVTRLRYSNPLVGRMRSDRRVWNHAFRHRWLWGLKAGVLLVWHFIYSHLFAIADIRRKANLRKILDIVAWTTSNQSVDHYAEKLLERFDGVKVVVLGHSHNWRRQSSERGTYLNIGHWSTSYRLVEPKLEQTWSRFRRLEFVWRVLIHFFRTGEVRLAWKMTKFVGLLALIAAMVAFIGGAFDHGAWTWWPLQPIVAKILVSIALIFLLVAGVFRLFSTEPEIKSDTKLTFGLIKHGHDGSLQADVMEYEPETGRIRECV